MSGIDKELPAAFRRLQDQIKSAAAAGEPLVIHGGNSKSFYGRECYGSPLNVTVCQGVIRYDPTELVITAYAGTALQELKQTLLQDNQMLAFEPPCYSDRSTLGGAVAAGLSGPRRPYTGAIRDFVLGTRCLNGRGEILRFGGEVMKNVAGYDISRLMTGALGTLGVLLEISLKVLPRPEYELALCKEISVDESIQSLSTWTAKPFNITGAAHEGGRLHLRLSGKQVAIESAWRKLGMQEDPAGLTYWQQLRDQQLPFFLLDSDEDLWRFSVPSNAPAIEIPGDWLIDWAGAQRWLKTRHPPEQVWQIAEHLHGHATLFRNNSGNDQVFASLQPVNKRLHLRLKQAFDPGHILNRGRMYPDI